MSSKLIRWDIVSIPAWCDWEPVATWSARARIYVSIPAWCDWESITGNAVEHYRRRFNSSMVRLGAVQLLHRRHPSGGFNSSMVRLGGSGSFSRSAQLSGFNSSMVRLGATGVANEDFLQFSFNSSMVRLGVPGKGRQAGGQLVSIPAWCDWENGAKRT